MARIRQPVSGLGSRVLPKKVILKDGRVAEIRFLAAGDSVRGLQMFINALVDEDAKIAYDVKPTRGAEIAWKRQQLEAFRKREGYLIVAIVSGRLAGNTGAHRDRGRGRDNACLGLSVARDFRGAGLGEALLRANIEVARGFLKPRNIYLSVFANNRPAKSLYRKLGFRKFASFPRWMRHKGGYVDHEFMVLRR